MFEWAHPLEEALREFPGVQLVLSSSWCIAPGYSKALRRLKPALRDRFIGGTFHRRVHGADPWTLQLFRSTPRWKQILDDVERRKPVHWPALDDDTEDWPLELLDNLVACEGTTGLSSSRVPDELQRKLFAASLPRETSNG